MFVDLVSDEITVELTKQFGDRFVTRVRFSAATIATWWAIVNSGVPFSSYVPTLVIDPRQRRSARNYGATNH